MSTADLLHRRIDELVELLRDLRERDEIAVAVDAAAVAIVAAVRGEGRVLLCGNGGSAADAQHLAAEFVGRFALDRRPFSALALSDNIAAVTAIGNDYTYEDVFVRGVNAHGRPGDVLFALSTSGNSANVLRAVEAAGERQMTSIALVGDASSPIGRAAQIVLAVAGPSTARIQEAHKLLGHTIFEIAERELCA